MLVHGRLRTDVWEREDGQTSVTYVVEATYVGHDLTRGTGPFLKAVAAGARSTPRRRPTQVRQGAAARPAAVDLPQLDSLGAAAGSTGRAA